MSADRKAPNTNAQHSSVTVEHYTPADIIEAARATLSQIDLDPASCARDNEVVKAETYFTQEQNGLDAKWRWYGNVWLNPPGGREGNRSRAGIWWKKLAEEYSTRRVKQAIFLGFSIEILAISQAEYPSCLDFPICVPRNRIKFLDTNLVPEGSPTHANVIVYLGPSPERFKDEFSKFGVVKL